jgi:hypothetical protein
VVRLPSDHSVPDTDDVALFGVLAIVRQTVRPDPRAGQVEVGSSLSCFIIAPDRDPVLVECSDNRDLLYSLFDATVALVKPDPDDSVVVAIRNQETEIANQLRRPSEA